MDALASAFTSYAHADRELVRRIADALKERGHQVWIDHAELRVGDSLATTGLRQPSLPIP